MNTRLNRRLTKLEGQYPTVRLNPVEAAEERVRLGVLCTLSPDDLEMMRDYAEQLQQDPGATPNPAQTAALEAYEQRYREFKSNGRLEINGWTVQI